MMVKAEMQYMYDEKGNKYLDAYNNVAHGIYVQQTKFEFYLTDD
jgi:acetylornithine/succinyldiaminopimelate/putrescine aminotransferase